MNIEFKPIYNKKNKIERYSVLLNQVELVFLFYKSERYRLDFPYWWSLDRINSFLFEANIKRTQMKDIENYINLHMPIGCSKNVNKFYNEEYYKSE